MKKEHKENLSLVFSIGGFAVGVIGVIGWLGVSPESVGQGMYDFLVIALPVIVFASGALAGTSIFNIWARHKLGITIDEAASRLGARINAHNFEDLSDQCKHLLLYAYGVENGFMRPTNTDTFPDGDNCLSILHSRHLLVKMPKPETVFAGRPWIMNRDARTFLREHEKVLADLEEGRARNREEAAKRKNSRLTKAWEKADAIHKLVVLKEMAEKDSETHGGYNVRPTPELIRSQLVSEEYTNEHYFYELEDGVAELFDAHPELYDEFGERSKDPDWIFNKIVSIYNEQDYEEDEE